MEGKEKQADNLYPGKLNSWQNQVTNFRGPDKNVENILKNSGNFITEFYLPLASLKKKI